MSGVLPPLGPGAQRHTRGDSDASVHSTHSRNGGGGGGSVAAPASSSTPQRSAATGRHSTAPASHSGSGSSIGARSYPSSSGHSSVSSIFRRPQRAVRDLDEDEEKIAPERQERVRMRGRYSKAHMAEFGMVFSSSELGSDRDASMGFDAETADPVLGAHYHRGAPLTLASMRPQGFEPSALGGQQRHRDRDHDYDSAPTFATEDEAAPRSNMDIGSYGQQQGLGLSSGGSGHNAQIAAATGKTIWQMWQRMKEERVRAHQREMARDVPRMARASPPPASAATAAVTATGEPSPSTIAPAPAPAARRDSLNGSSSSIDYAAAGRSIAAQLSRAGVRVSHDHLGVIHNLAGLEKVWLRSETGLEQDQFVSFLQEVLRLPPGELAVLFQKMDANADGSLSWDEYLSYLLIEVGHHWQFRAARGTWWLRDVDAPAVSTNVSSGSGAAASGHGGHGGHGAGAQGVQVGQILVIPGGDASSPSSGGAGGGGGGAGGSRYVLSCRDNTIQVWQGGEGEGSLSFQCHLPAPWRGGGFGGGGGGAAGAPSGLGYGFGASGGGGGPAGSNLAGEESVGASAARHLSSQSNRIGTRRAGTGAGRQKRCGGGGWKEDSSSAATGSWRGGGGGGGDGVGAVDESISRRVAAHTGLSRMGLGGGGDGMGDRVSYGRVHSRWGGGGADAHQDQDGGEGDGGSDGDGDAGDSPGHGGSFGGDAPPLGGDGGYARSRGAGFGVQNTCVAYYPPSRQILVARMDKTVHMFQSTASASSGSSTGPSMLRRGLGRTRGRGWGGAGFLQVDRTEVVDTPQCMGVHVPLSSPASFQSGALSSGANANGDLLIVGDTSGRCSAYALPVMRDFGSGGGGSDKSGSITQGGFSYAYSSPGGVGVPASASGAGAASILGLGPSSAGAGTFASGGGGSAGAGGRPHLFQIHRPGESIRRIAMLPTVGLLSAGMDGLLAISDLEAGRVVRELKGHKRGVYSFAHCEEHRCIFSAGFDSRVLVFDPYLPAPTGSLGASHGRVVDVLVNERKNQVVTVCADKKVKVFDIRTWGCIQSLADSQDYAPRDELTAAAFDSPSQCLVTAGNKVRLWPVVMAPGNKSRRGGPAHNNLVVAICYSSVFEQVISVSVDEAVHVWDVYTGQSVFEFRTSHASPLTAACLDHRGKRLLTGAHDGSVLMWNFHNGARMHEFQSRKKELLALLYLPRTLQCVVGIGLERSVVRWPDPNAPKNTKWLVQSDHRAEVLSVAYHDSILVTGATDGEIIVWYRDSALVSKRFDIPKTPRTGKRPGVAKMLFIDFPGGLVLLLAGTDDGSLHFIKVASSETVFSVYEVCAEPIVGMAANRVRASAAAANSASGSESGSGSGSAVDGARTRLMVCDCQVDAKLFDLSFVSSSSSSSGHIESLPLLKSWEPHPGGTTTDLIALDALGCFAASSDTGDITIWDAESGEARGKFAQRKTWPVADPRASSHRDRSAQPPQGDGRSGERRDQSSGNDDDDSDDSDDSGSDGSDSDSDEDDDAKPGLSRRASVLSSDSSRSRSHRESKKASRRKGSRKAKGKGKVGASAAPPRKEPSYAETHPMYVPRDDCDRYLQEHAQQMHMEAAAAAAAARAAAREKEEHGSRRAGGAAGGHGSKSHLADMLNKLEADLRHQHAHEQQRERGAATGAGSGFGSGTGSGSGSGTGAGPDSKHNVHSNAHSYARERERERDRDRDRDRSHGGHHAHGTGTGTGMGDVSAAVLGAHVYERFHTHHATGTSLSNNGSSAGVNFASSSSSSFSPANTTDPAGDSFSAGGSATHRSSRVRHLTVEEEPNSASGSISSFSASGSQTARAPHRPSARRTDPPASVRSTLTTSGRAISNSDAFTQPLTARNRQQRKG